MPIFTENQFRNLASTKAGIYGLKGVVYEERQYSKYYANTSVFLSHSHKDKDKIEQAKYIFENLGVRIYVDWMDSTMPERTNGITAQNIKTKIQDNKKFVLLGTNRAVESKWCNWEVGIGDTYKLNHDSIAVIGIANNSGTWEGNEYLQIYPSIEYIEKPFINTLGNYAPPGYYVFYPSMTYNRRSITLRQWLLK